MLRMVNQVYDTKRHFNTELLKRQCDIKNNVFLTYLRNHQLIKYVANAKLKTKTNQIDY